MSTIFQETNTRIAALPGIVSCSYGAKEARQALAIQDALGGGSPGAANLANTLAQTNPVALAAGSGVIVTADTTSTYLLIQNIGSNDVYIKFGSAASLTDGHQLLPGDVWESYDPLFIQGTVEAIADTADSQLYVARTITV